MKGRIRNFFPESDKKVRIYLDPDSASFVLSSKDPDYVAVCIVLQGSGLCCSVYCPPRIRIMFVRGSSDFVAQFD